jgi:hypothetical protein
VQKKVLSTIYIVIILSRVRGLRVTYRRVLDWMIGFINTLYIQLGTPCNYSAISDLYTLQFTVTHALEFLVFTSRILATDFHTVVISVCHCSTHEVFFAQSNSLLAISSQSTSTVLSRTLPSSNSSCVKSSLYSLEADPQKTPLPLLLRRRVYSTTAYQQKFFDCCLRIRCRGNVFTEHLPSNGRLLWFHYSGFRASYHSTLALLIFLSSLQKIRTGIRINREQNLIPDSLFIQSNRNCGEIKEDSLIWLQGKLILVFKYMTWKCTGAGRWDIVPHILSLSTRESEWSVSRCDRLTPEETDPLLPILCEIWWVPQQIWKYSLGSIFNGNLILPKFRVILQGLKFSQRWLWRVPCCHSHVVLSIACEHVSWTYGRVRILPGKAAGAWSWPLT